MSSKPASEWLRQTYGTKVLNSAPRSGGYDRQYGEFTGFYEEVNEDVDEDDHGISKV